MARVFDVASVADLIPRRFARSTPEEDLDAMVLGTSFHLDGQGTATAADAMKRYCGLLGGQEMEGKSPAQWLATKELAKDHGEMVFEDDISRFCPKRAR
ncbi:hypothetical protein AB5L52_37295 [Streptomyces sp. CG4]|uniref:hypothetical protein n=1 Tax=Streptomyces sp. CG4 TaxID=408783 RepID=UPI0034E2E9EB